MTRGTTPATALTFVKNSATSLEACLQCMTWCREHVLLDGGSTDETLDLAKMYGCRVISQNATYLNTEGRIIDYAGITNQGIAASTYPWIIITDSDEYIDQELIQEMQKHIAVNKPEACFVERLYTLDGHTIKAASTYPNRQIRLFHKDAITEFIKVVHERPALRSGITPIILPGIQFVPLDSIPDLRKKYLRYLDLEVQHAGGKGFINWFRLLFNKLLRMTLRIVRIIGQRLTHRWRDCLPLQYEWLHIWYPWQIIVRTFPSVNRNNAKKTS